MRVFVSSIAGASALTLSNHGRLDVTKMNPDRVAELLRETQAEWVGFALNEKSHEVAQAKMLSSCGDIVTSMVTASAGDKGRVDEYFREVCMNEDTKCQSFAGAVMNFLSDDPEMNRESLDTKKLCTSFWSHNIEAYAERAEEERVAAAKAEREAAAKKKAEELERKERAQRVADEAKKQREAAIEKRRADAKARVEKEAAAKVAEEKNSVEGKKKEAVAAPEVGENASRTKPVNVLKKKASSQQVLASAVGSAENMVESKVKSFASTVSHFMDSMQGRLGNTMADILRREKKTEPVNHSVYQNSSSHQYSVVKTAVVSDTAHPSIEQARARGQAEVALKVSAIKARIDAKFEEEAKNAAAAVPKRK